MPSVTILLHIHLYNTYIILITKKVHQINSVFQPAPRLRIDPLFDDLKLILLPNETVSGGERDFLEFLGCKEN